MRFSLNPIDRWQAAFHEDIQRQDIGAPGTHGFANMLGGTSDAARTALGQTPQNPWGSLGQQYPGSQYDPYNKSAMAGLGGGGGKSEVIASQAYGNMPASASPLSQAIMGQASQLGAAGMYAAANPYANYQGSLAGQAMNQNVADQQQAREQAYQQSEWQRGGGIIQRRQQEAQFAAQQRAQAAELAYQQQMRQQAIQAAQLRNQAMQQMMSMSGQPMQGFSSNVTNPAQQYLQSVYGTDPMQSQMYQGALRAGQAGIESAFNDPGGLRSQMQRLQAQQGRYSADSVMGAQRQAALDRQRGLAEAQAVPAALQAYATGMQPGLQAAGTTTGFAGQQLAAETARQAAQRQSQTSLWQSILGQGLPAF